MKKIKAPEDYTLQVWWTPQQVRSEQRKKVASRRTKVLTKIKNFDQNPNFIEKKQNRLKIKTLADYFIDAQIQHLDQAKLMYEPEELAKVKIITLRNNQKEELKTLILKLNNNRKWIIALHGWGEDKYLALHQTYLLAQLGFNILTFDTYGHGQSYGVETDFGFQSYKDIELLATYLKRNYGMNHYGLIGLSSGASTILRHVQKIGYRDSQLKFVISDCGFANLDKELKFFFEQNFSLPWWKFSYLVRNKFKKYFGFDPKEFNLLKSEDMERVAQIPILFIHGTKDKKIDAKDAYRLYKQKIYFENPTHSQLLLVPRVGHKEVMSKDSKRYKQGVIKFLKSINEI